MQFATLAVIAASSVQAGVSISWSGRSSKVTWPSDWAGTWNCALPFSWRLSGTSCSSKSQYYPQPPANCPPGYPHPYTPWDPVQWTFPGKCKKHPSVIGPIYPSGCKTNTGPKPTKSSSSAAGPTSTKASGTSTTSAVATPTIVPTPKTNFTLDCPVVAAGQIFDGQIQCNSPYPAADVASGATTAIVASTFYLLDGGLYDQFGRGCEISSGNQLQCNALTNGATAEAGFAIDTNGDLIWQGENTWYGCNIGTDSSFGQIIFTGTHLDFDGTSSPTSDNNPNCIALRLGATFVA